MKITQKAVTLGKISIPVFDFIVEKLNSVLILTFVDRIFNIFSYKYN